MASIALLLLSLFILAGGLIGYFRAHSTASLIAGGISSELLLIACAFSVNTAQRNIGLLAGLLITLALDVIFAKRLVKTKKFMPSGLALILCGGTQIALIIDLLS